MSTTAPMTTPTRPPSGPSPLPYQPPQAKQKRRNPIAAYTHWLHTMWPAGTPEKLPVVHEDGSTNVPGLYVVGDLTGIPLLKFSADTGARAAQKIAQELKTASPAGEGELDLVIIGAGVSGMAAALEARKLGLRFEILEAAEPFSTIVNFPKGKPIFTYPTDMTPAGDLQFSADVKEALVDEIKRQTAGIVPRSVRVERVARSGGMLKVMLAGEGKAAGGEMTARRVIVAIGRSGNFRKLGVPGEEMGKVYNRLHDPKEFKGKHVLVVGGGDSAAETAVALTQCGAYVTFSHRGELTRPKPENIERVMKLEVDPMAAGQIENPVSERVTTAIGDFMGDWRKPGQMVRFADSKVTAIGDADVTLKLADGTEKTIPNDAVFSMIGREAPLDFFRKSGVAVAGDRTATWWITLLVSLAVFVFIYHWKKDDLHILPFPPFSWIAQIGDMWKAAGLFPYNVPAIWQGLGGWFADRSSLLGTIKVSLGEPGFWYSAAYCSAIVGFGIARIRRRRTPYVRLQTISLAAFQLIPLFFLPYVVLPWMGNNGLFGDRYRTDNIPAAVETQWTAVAKAETLPTSIDPSILPSRAADWGPLTASKHWAGVELKDAQGQRSLIVDAKHGSYFFTDNTAPSSWIADQLFPSGAYGHGREYWRAIGFILAWPLFIWNVFTTQPMWLWLGISVFQTFVIIPGIIYFWGKGAYCGWICSCGALAETMGDAHRAKMPHGPFWNRFNMVGQAFLAFALLLAAFRVVGWATGPESWASQTFEYLLKHIPLINYVWMVDLLWAGILGVALYWHFSGRVWCRFACPLAALMHIYARFSRFRILADKKKCISCNVCTSVCHQGIDIMNFANKGLPMADPECVRCSACVQSCPTGVLSFGQIDRKTGKTIAMDPPWLAASRVQLVELTVKGKPAH